MGSNRKPPNITQKVVSEILVNTRVEEGLEMADSGVSSKFLTTHQLK